MNEKLQLLVVDDDRSDQFIIEGILLEAPGDEYEISFACSLREGIEAANSGEFDAVLLDLVLPETRGLETVLQFRENVPDVPIIVLSGVHDESISLSALEVGAQDYIAKENLEFHTLAQSIRYAMQRQDLQQRIVDLAYADAVTGLPNRVKFEDLLNAEFEASCQPGYPGDLYVLFLDLDEFKWVNDTFGHYVGDQLLAEFADRVLNVKCPTDTVARFGGDEFVVLMPHTNNRRVDFFVGRLEEELRRPFQIGVDQKITASIGIVKRSATHTSSGDLLRDADTAMYQAKEDGKSHAQWFTPEMRDAAVDRINFESQLRMALERHQFELFYQPILNMSTR
ncbi:MAG: diguanylate cyclase, partial [Planctomycetota bacterium]